MYNIIMSAACAVIIIIVFLQCGYDKNVFYFKYKHVKKKFVNTYDSILRRCGLPPAELDGWRGSSFISCLAAVTKKTAEAIREMKRLRITRHYCVRYERR